MERRGTVGLACINYVLWHGNRVADYWICREPVASFRGKLARNVVRRKSLLTMAPLLYCNLRTVDPQGVVPP